MSRYRENITKLDMCSDQFNDVSNKCLTKPIVLYVVLAMTWQCVIACQCAVRGACNDMAVRHCLQLRFSSSLPRDEKYAAQQFTFTCVASNTTNWHVFFPGYFPSSWILSTGFVWPLNIWEFLTIFSDNWHVRLEFGSQASRIASFMGHESKQSDMSRRRCQKCNNIQFVYKGIDKEEWRLLNKQYVIPRNRQFISRKISLLTINYYFFWEHSYERTKLLTWTEMWRKIDMVMVAVQHKGGRMLGVSEVMWRSLKEEGGFISGAY